MGNYYRNKINRWRSKMVKRRLAAGQGPDDYEFGMAATEAEKADATIATLTAERDQLKERVRELVEAMEKAIAAWESHNFDGTPEAVAMERAIVRCEDIIWQLQLKEQDDAAKD